MYDTTHHTNAEVGNMGMMGDTLPNPLAWQFMQEPLYRWLIFLIAIGFLLNAWRSVLSYMK